MEYQTEWPFQHDSDLFSGLVECRNIIRLGLVFAPMMRVLFAVSEQVAMQLLDVVFCERDLAPGLKDQLHGFGITGHFLLVPRCERFDIEIRKQSLNFTIREFAAFDAGR